MQSLPERVCMAITERRVHNLPGHSARHADGSNSKPLLVFSDLLRQLRQLVLTQSKGTHYLLQIHDALKLFPDLLDGFGSVEVGLGPKI